METPVVSPECPMVKELTQSLENINTCSTYPDILNDANDKKNFNKLSKNILKFLLTFLNLNDMLVISKLSKRFSNLFKESDIQNFLIFKELIKQKYKPSRNVHKHLQTKVIEIKRVNSKLPESEITDLIISYIYYRTKNKFEDFYRLSEHKLDTLFEFYVFYYMKFISSPLCHLINLNISRNLLTQSSLHALSTAIGANKSIVSLDMSDLTYLTYESTQSYPPFQEALARNTTLKKIICNDGKPNGILESIFNGLTHNKSVQEVYVCQQRTRPSLVASIADCMLVNETITTLSLSNWNFDETDKINILKSLVGNKSLRNFYFSGVGLEKDSVVYLSNYIKLNKSLLNLNISNNLIRSSQENFNLLFQAIKANSCIKSINISSNELDDSNSETICDCLLKHPSLKEVNLSLNKFTDSSAPFFINLVKENSELKLLKLIGNKFVSQFKHDQFHDEHGKIEID